MPSFGSLNIAYTGLNAHQQRINVIGENITNVNTPGYHKQRVDLGPIHNSASGLIVGEFRSGGGVQVLDIARVRDKTLSDHARNQGGRAAAASERADILHALEDVIGGLNPGGLHDQMTDLFNSFDDLAGSPDDPAMRRVVLQRAEIVGQGFTRTAGDVDDLRARTEEELFDTVRAINSLSEQIASADAEILGANTIDADPNTLTDQRDAMITELAALADVTISEQADGQVTISLDGQLLVSNGLSQDLEVVYAVDPTLTPLGYADLNVVNQQGRELNVTGGTLAAQLEALQTTIPDGRRALDGVAADLATQVNAIHSVGVGLDGSTGNNLLEVGPNTGELRLSPDVAGLPDRVATRLPGSGLLDNGNVRQLAQLADDPAGPMAGFVTAVGELAAKVSASDGQANAADIAKQQADTMALAAGGVSLDEELTDLITAQRAYEASARIMTSIDEMLQTLMTVGLVGR
ncbi:MAG: flagellar hook-associated protein FlgK [Actinomycetota bacterium]